MSLAIDVTRAAASPLARQRLVDAILKAPPTEPETDYLEWKTGVDLREYRAVIAKHILGFANRDVDRAARHMEGAAYLVLGAAPGELSGVDPTDPADLVNWLSPFVGLADGPQWDPHYVEVRSTQVLIIGIAAPREGDRPWPCRRTTSQRVGGETRQVVRDGAIYIRRAGQTVEASAAEHDMLERRRTRSPRTLINLEPRDGKPIVVRPVDTSSESIEAWIKVEEARLMRALDRARPRKVAPAGGATNHPDPFKAMADRQAQMLEAMGALAGQRPDRRSPDEYKAAVATYVDKLRSKLPPYLRWKAAARHHLAPIALDVTNMTEQNFAQVQVRVHVGGSAKALDGSRDAPQLPSPPREFGPESLVPDLGLKGLDRYAFSTSNVLSLGPRVRVDNSGSVGLTFPEFDLRPAYMVQLEEVQLIVDMADAGGLIEATWYATSTSAPGLSEGRIEIHVAPEAATAAELMTAPARPDGDANGDEEDD